jgi:hypothetical protein
MLGCLTIDYAPALQNMRMKIHSCGYRALTNPSIDQTCKLCCLKNSWEDSIHLCSIWMYGTQNPKDKKSKNSSSVLWGNQWATSLGMHDGLWGMNPRSNKQTIRPVLLFTFFLQYFPTLQQALQLKLLIVLLYSSCVRAETTTIMLQSPCLSWSYIVVQETDVGGGTVRQTIL